MQFKIRNIDIVYNADSVIEYVNLRFDSNQNNEDTWINGFVKISADEYMPIAGDLPALADLTLTKVKAKLAV